MSTLNTFSTLKNTITGNAKNGATGEAFEQTVNAQGRGQDKDFKANSQDRLQRGLSDIQASLDESLAMGEANRQASKEMALDANKTALNDACNKTLAQSGASFKAAAGA